MYDYHFWLIQQVCMLGSRIFNMTTFFFNCVDIHSVSPHIGSTQGGTLITVVGSSFGTNVSDIEVDVDGIPCHVMTHNMTHITCWSGRPRDNDLSVADADGSYSVTAGGHRFRGTYHSFLHTLAHSLTHHSLILPCFATLSLFTYTYGVQVHVELASRVTMGPYTI